jgi:hypothetical protein
MKRIVCAALFLAAAFTASCQKSVPIIINTVTIQWDASIGAPADIRYEVFYGLYPGGTMIQVSTVSALEYVITLPAEGNYRFSVRAMRTIDGINYYSDFIYSEIDGIPEPWYISYVKILGKPQRLRVK